MSTTQQVTVPVIDIAPLVHSLSVASTDTPVTPACSNVISALSAAARSHGIFAITGHGIPLDIMDAALLASRHALDIGGHAEIERWQELEAQFSKRLPGELANFTQVGRENVGRLYNGDTQAPGEAVAKFSVWPSTWDKDPTVAERCRNVWPPTANGDFLRDVLERYYGEVQRVSDVLHCGLAQSIGQPANFMKDTLEPYGTGVLRAMRYQRKEDADISAPAMAAHKDLGTTTLLLSDTTGLQFQPYNSSEWVDVVVPRGALAVNLGEFFEVWTRGTWHATLHRVSASGRHGRTSLAFFSNQGIPIPSDGSAPKDCTIAPLAHHSESQQPSGGHSQQTVKWPSYFFERLSGLAKGLDGSADTDVTKHASTGGA